MRSDRHRKRKATYLSETLLFLFLCLVIFIIVFGYMEHSGMIQLTKDEGPPATQKTKPYTRVYYQWFILWYNINIHFLILFARQPMKGGQLIIKHISLKWFITFLVKTVIWKKCVFFISKTNFRRNNYDRDIIKRCRD